MVRHPHQSNSRRGFGTSTLSFTNMLLQAAPALLATTTLFASVWSAEADALPSTGNAGFYVPKSHVPGDVLLRLRDFAHDDYANIARNPAMRAKLDAVMREVSKDTGYRVNFVRRMQFGWAIFHIESRTGGELDETQTEVAYTKISQHSSVAKASLNKWFKPLRVPNDEYSQFLWGLDSIGAPAAWDITVGSNAQRLGVVDTGTLRNHEDLSGRTVAGFDFISNSNQAADGNGRDSDFNDPGDGADCGFGQQPSSFHGSHVAGTILANTDNGVGIAGLNWNAQLVTGRALGRCGGSSVDILEAEAWLGGFQVDGVAGIGNNKVSVINLSLGGGSSCSNIEADYIDIITNQAGVVFVAAAGNDGNNVPVSSPASCPGAIAVAAYSPNATRTLTPYSNFGSEISIVAPGGDLRFGEGGGIVSLYGPETNAYVSYEGTSMATPHVAGAVSLMLAVNPNLSTSQIVQIMQETGQSCSGCGNKKAMRLDLAVARAGNVQGNADAGVVDNGIGEGPCGLTGTCADGQTCVQISDGADGARCLLNCNVNNGSGCNAGDQCISLDASTTICVPAGNTGRGGDCSSDFFACSNGNICLGTSDDASQCFARCDMGFTCPSATPRCVSINNGTIKYCDVDPNVNNDAGTPVDAGNGNNGGNDSGTPNPVAGDCDPRRGNWDCANGSGCVVGNDNIARCVAGADGEQGSGALCEEDAECASGLCDRGVCTVPCDDGCRDGYSCDQDAIPGGLCRPDSCREDGDALCQSDWFCVYSSKQRYVCAAEGTPAFGSTCAGIDERDAPVAFGILGLLSAVGAGARIRLRRRAQKSA